MSNNDDDDEPTDGESGSFCLKYRIARGKYRVTEAGVDAVGVAEDLHDAIIDYVESVRELSEEQEQDQTDTEVERGEVMADGGWHPCDYCGAEYRSQRAALRCCSDQFDDDLDDDLLPVGTPDAHGSIMTDGGRSLRRGETAQDPWRFRCPACDSVSIRRRSFGPSGRGGAEFLCNECNHDFDEPADAAADRPEQTVVADGRGEVVVDVPDEQTEALAAARELPPSDIVDVTMPIDWIFHAEMHGVTSEPVVTVNFRGFFDASRHRFLGKLAAASGWEVVDATPVRDRVTLHRVAEPADGHCGWCDEPVESLQDHWDAPSGRCPRDV